MMENGVKLYSEADLFTMTAGTLLSHLSPRNASDTEEVARRYKAVISAFFEVQKASVIKNHPYTTKELQMRRDFTISALRRTYTKFCEKAYKQLEQNRWKG